MPSFDKMAKAFQTNGGEGKLHEYYVTASLRNLQSASNNIDVNALEEPAPPVKKKIPVQDPKKPKPNVPKPSTPTQPSVKKEITDVKIFKTSDITLKVHVYYNGLQGKKIRFKLMEDDGGYLVDDELINQVFDLPKNSDCMYIDIDLKKVSKSKGDDTFEGWEQELFVDIEVLETHSHTKTATLNVNNSGFGTDPVDDSNKVVKVGATEKTEGKSCGEKYCIKKGDKSELIREINIRLAGFGGNVPTDEFTDRTEKMIKQFQRDYMKVPETGKVCGNVLKAIDEFSTKYNFTFDQVKCKCGTCTGFGDNSNKGLYLKNLKDEGHHRYEYPGLHRSLLSSVRAVIFYLAKDGRFSLNKINSGYRCRFHEEYLKKPTTNHMGKALDLHFNDSKGKRTRTTADMNTIRKDVFNKYLGAKWDWKEGNIFNLESEAVGALTWVHYDVREFSSIYHDDKYFVKTLADLNGKSIVSLANELGFEKTCICFGGGNKSEPNVNKPVVAGSCEDKFKKVAPIILKHEGGYVNDPDDSGGETNKGITIGTFKQYAKEDLGIEPTSENLKKITDDQATIIYRKRYWEPKGFCKIEDDKVSLMIYDWTITSGGAAKKVQELLIDEFDKKITADGGIGSKTIEAINSVEDQDKLLKRIGAIRKEYYTNLAIKDGKHTKNYKFLDGWHNRVDDCLNIKL
ncbi:hypothetical protein B0A58_15335 [Flavobacterium branchiophilum NBRC 15030 = ATCC 35035]|uniref:Putative peptidoglycan binding protein n=2 Tax=Flavobacterium branchiophilum TaxID=55197 RepID=A0A543G2A9_9FLAO|nr:glycosyl hydrolase 108 family protein [Flavobacterium branchiophilum]OXA69655.1 hypothetical protein B0A58_15335 [Flavobacterium branchiophilum NBRC 15030 = ATCC 35035]TQM40189.1 putative peptidoglycan binding protein [Flavobacterium branchiophilum]